MNKTFIVLGMHRSATSLIAKALHSIGVNMGDRLLPPANDNPEGFFEDIEFLQTNIQLLGGDRWANPPEGLQDIDVEKLIKRKDVAPLWGWKDPRTVLTIEKYYDLLEDPILVCVFRKPEHVGASLERRGNMSKEQGVKLADEYNQRLLTFLNKKFRK